MNQSSLEKQLQQQAPAPDPAARIAARRAAVEEFKRLHGAVAPQSTSRRGIFQGLSGLLRPSRHQQDGSDSMPWITRNMWLSGAASICVALVGGTIVWNTLKQHPELTELSQAGTTPRGAGSETGTAVQTAPVGSSSPEITRTEPEQGDALPANAASDVQSNEPAATAPRVDDARVRIEVQQRAAEDKAKQDEVAKESAENEQAAAALASQAADGTAQAKREAGAAADAITADDLGKLPDVSLSESLQRIPGVKASGPTPAAPLPNEQGQEVVVTGQRAGLKTAMEMRRSVSGYTGPEKNAIAANAPPAPPPPPQQVTGRDKFEHFELNSIKRPQLEAERFSTFSADVDTSSYSFVRKQLDQGVLPQKDSVRIEEMVNYFDYSWPTAESREQPFRPTVVVSDSPWGKGRKLIHIGIKGYELPAKARPDANLVMLLDVSGSMDEPDKLPLVKQSMKLLLGSLKPTDTVAIVVYAGAAGMVLPPTPVGDKEEIHDALDRLQAGGSTAGAEGIELAYQLAEKSFRKEAVNRVILCTDGDFNVGIDSTNELKGYVERKREKGIFLSVLGFGQGNYRDELAQALAQNGNGVAAYIDTVNEARKVLVQEAVASLFTIAKDVKLQVEFNPATVAEYRLVGYETRALKQEDFKNDKVDAGDIGAGHTVTAIYEITPVGVDARMIEPGRYADEARVATKSKGNEYGFLRIRYKLPDASVSKEMQTPITIDSGKVPESIERDVQFSTAVAGFAQLLRGGQFTVSLSYEDVIKQGLAARGEDPYGYRNEFVQLVRKAQAAK